MAIFSADEYFPDIGYGDLDISSLWGYIKNNDSKEDALKRKTCPCDWVAHCFRLNLRFITQNAAFFCDFIALAITHALCNLIIAWWGGNQQCFCCHIILVKQCHVKFKEKRKILACHEAWHQRWCSLSVLQLLQLSCSSVAKMQVRSRWGNFRKNQAGSVRVESVNVNKKFLNFLQRQVNHQQVVQMLGYKPAHKQWSVVCRPRRTSLLRREPAIPCLIQKWCKKISNFSLFW